MTLDALLQALEDHLAPLVIAASGRFAVAQNELDALEMLDGENNHFRVIMCPVGGDSGESGDQGGYVADTISFFLQTPRLDTNDTAKGLHRDKAGRGQNFLGRLGWLKQTVRAISINSPEVDRECGRTLQYRDWDLVKVDGQPATMRAARIRFRINYILDDPEVEADGNILVAPTPYRITGVTEDGIYYIISLRGAANARVARFAAGAGDPGGQASGYAITGPAAEDGFYTVAFDGVPNGRIAVEPIA